MTAEELYKRAEADGIAVVRVRSDKKAMCVDNGRIKAVCINYHKIEDERDERAVLAEELVHLDNGYLYAVNNVKNPAYRTLVSRLEQRTKNTVACMFIPFDRLKDAVLRDGCRELWELAEYFDVPPAIIRNAVDYYESRGMHIDVPEDW